MEAIKYYVGYVMHLGTEDNVRRNGLQTQDLDGTWRTPSIGHAGEGVNPNFSDFAHHDAVCTKIEDGRVFMKCACDLEWSFKIN